MASSNSPVTTVVTGIIALILGFPVAVAAIVFESVYVPNVILGSKTINTGLGSTKTLSFSLLTGPNDVVTAAAIISMVSSILVMIGVVLTRHVTRHNIWGWLVFGPALSNLLGQIACCAAAFIFESRYPVATSTNEVQYVNGTYNTDGRLFTKEAWSCTMNNLYADRESWADKACSDFKTGRILTVPLIVCSVFLLGIAYWQVHLRGGFGWLFGQREKVSTAYAPQKDYIDLEDD